MRVVKDNVILLEGDEFKKLCKPGSADTCIWAMVGSDGFACHYYNRPSGLVSRWRQGLTNAKRNGCEEIKKLGLVIRYVWAPTLQEIIN